MRRADATGGAGGFEAWVLASLTSGVVGIDGEGAIAVLNGGAQRILGCPEGDPAAAIGRDCREVLAAQPRVARLLLDARTRCGPLSRAELVLAAPPGARAGTIGFTLAQVRDAQARPAGAAMIFRDLAPVERADEQERLRERLAVLGQMAAGLAHEIRNPLAGMEVVAGLLRRRLADRPEDQELVTELIGELRAVARTVAGSLEFVRPSTPLRAPLDAVTLLEDSLAAARTRAPFEGTVEREYAAPLPRLSGDEDLLRTALTNLIVNAFEAMGGSGALTLRVAARKEDSADPELCLSVSDSGPGIPAELREKVFYPFFTTKRTGSGVGLASAQKIVASHGGSIELDSAPGSGCKFCVRLPAEAEGLV
jgi:signal transduction histidine kinase